MIGYIPQATGSFAGALILVGANAAVAIFCYLFIVGEIKRVEFKQSATPRDGNVPSASGATASK